MTEVRKEKKKKLKPENKLNKEIYACPLKFENIILM
jgi:hypothetical protein